MGLVLAWLWRLCILQDTVLVCFGVFVLVFLLLGVCYWCYVQQLSTFMPKYLHGLQCSVVLPIYDGIIRYNVVYLFFLSFIHFQRGQ